MRNITPAEIEQRIEDYRLAIEPLARMLTRIELLQPTGYIFDHVTGLQTVKQLGWSEEAKKAYQEIKEQIEEIRRKYFGEEIHEGQRY